MYIDAIKISLTTCLYQARAIPCLKVFLGFGDKPYSMKTETSVVLIKFGLSQKIN